MKNWLVKQKSKVVGVAVVVVVIVVAVVLSNRLTILLPNICHSFMSTPPKSPHANAK